jgi:hypothetical protein
MYINITMTPLNAPYLTLSRSADRWRSLIGTRRMTLRDDSTRDAEAIVE